MNKQKMTGFSAFFSIFFIFFSSLQFEPLETFKERASDDIPRIELSTIKIASAGDRRFNVAVFNPHPFSVTKVVHIKVSSPHIRVASQGIVECQIRPAYKHLDVPKAHGSINQATDVVSATEKEIFILSFVASMQGFGLRTFLLAYNSERPCQLVDIEFVNVDIGQVSEVSAIDKSGFQYSVLSPDENIVVNGEHFSAVFEPSSGKLVKYGEYGENVPLSIRQINMKNGRSLKPVGDAKVRVLKGPVVTQVDIYNSVGITRYEIYHENCFESQFININTFSKPTLLSAADTGTRVWSLEIASSQFALENFAVSTDNFGKTEEKLKGEQADSTGIAFFKADQHRITVISENSGKVFGRGGGLYMEIGDSSYRKLSTVQNYMIRIVKIPAGSHDTKITYSAVTAKEVSGIGFMLFKGTEHIPNGSPPAALFHLRVDNRWPCDIFLGSLKYDHKTGFENLPGGQASFSLWRANYDCHLNDLVKKVSCQEPTFDVSNLGALVSTRKDVEQYQSEITAVLEGEGGGTNFVPIKMRLGERKVYKVVGSVGAENNF
jgi:hypothetical protein